MVVVQLIVNLVDCGGGDAGGSKLGGSIVLNSFFLFLVLD